MFFPRIWIICRVCLQQQEEMVNMFDNKIHNNIWAILRDCGGVPVRKNDPFPDKICVACLRRLWEAMNFRIDCQRSHRDLLQKQMEADALLWEEENEVEFLKISSQDIPKNTKEILQVPVQLDENDHSVKIKTDEDIDNERNDLDIKQYCVVTKNSKIETNEECCKESQQKQPIVLLLRLKNVSYENSQNETKQIEQPETEEKNVTPTKKIARKNLTKASNKKTEVKKDIKLKKTRVKTKIKRSVRIRRIEKVKKTKKFPCKICQKSFTTNELLRHHNYTHKKPYECQICHKKFSQGHSFLSHNNTHTGIKPYYCRTCFETFSDMCNRNAHERLNHKEAQFKCNKCNKSFRVLSLLEKHSIIHKPKKCFICNMDFASVRMVRFHHRRIHLKLLEL